MSKSSKNLFRNQNKNFSISNSIILNNYSIQNVIFSSSNINSYEKLPLNTNNNNSNQISFSPIPKKSVIKTIFPITTEQSNIFKNNKSMPNNKSMSRLNYLNIKRIPIIKKNKITIQKLMPISNISVKKEKHPQDSKKKLDKKKKYYF